MSEYKLDALTANDTQTTLISKCYVLLFANNKGIIIIYYHYYYYHHHQST